MAGQLERLFDRFSKMPAGNLGVSLFCLLTLFSTCSIQNSSGGGKRFLPYPGFRLCTSCGGVQKGNCHGPDLCCVKGACFGGAEVKLSCMKEKSFPLGCTAGWKRCEAGGRCVRPGLCCTDEGCLVDPSCPQ